MMEWLDRWLGSKRIFISKSFYFGWPTGSKDCCKICGVIRESHKDKDHRFFEEK